MSHVLKEKQNETELRISWLNPKVLVLLFLGFSAGVPILLIFSTLSIWLTEAGVIKSTVTFFSWAALGYSFKFLWAPLVDLLPLPILTRLLGRRRSWLLLSQLSIIAAILWMASVNPAQGMNYLTIMAFAAVHLGFSSATQDIVIDAYRIECADQSLQALLSSMYITGYRLGMIVAGAGSLFLADIFGAGTTGYVYTAWQKTYYIMAAVMLCGVITTLLIEEPKLYREGRQISYEHSTLEYLRFLVVFVLSISSFAASFFFLGGVLHEYVGQILLEGKLSGVFGSFFTQVVRFFLAASAGILTALLCIQLGIAKKQMVYKSYVEPIKDFFTRYGMQSAALLLLLVGFYRLSDIVLGVISNVFYVDMGFSKSVIGGVTKTFGPLMTILGGILGGVLSVRFGVNTVLLLGAILSSATNLLFMMLAFYGADITMLSVVIGADNLSAGIATTAFVAFLSSLTSISFTAVQYAIFSSVMTLFPKLIGGYSGMMVSSLGYQNFFLLTALMGIPVIALVIIVKNRV